MATTDVERLVVSLEASITKYQRAMDKALGQTNSTAKRIENRFVKMNRNLSSTFGSLGTGLKLFAGAAALRSAQQLLDANTRITNSLKVTGAEGENLTKIYDALFQSAQRNAAPFESLTELYSRASLSAKDLGVSQERLLKFTDSIAVALRVNGKSASESSGALLQLSQLLGSGTVRAEEFNSVQEGALPILQAVAAGIKQAGGSVSKLRTLVIAGKLSSKAFFDGYEAGSYILEDKVANAAFTTEQSFENLKTALIGAAGKFDEATNASEDFATFLQQISTLITDLSNNEGLGKLLGFVNSFGNAQFAGSLRDIERISNAVSKAIDFVNRQGDFTPAATSADAVAKALDDINTAAVGARDSGEMIDGAVAAIDRYFNAVNALSGEGGPILVTPEMEAQLASLIGQMILGEQTADETKTAIIELANANPNFSGVISDVYALVDALAAAKNGAVEVNTALAQPQGQVFHGGPHRPPSAASSNSGDTIDITDPNYKPTGGRGSGGGRGGRSPAQRFSDTLAEKQRELDNLKEETALRAQLNPLINDGGEAEARLRMQQELLNAAAKAGVDLSPAQRQAIDDLAAGYGQATAEAARLAEAQDEARQQMEDWFSSAKDWTKGFIQDLADGKSATEALGNALGKLADKLLDIGLNSLFGTGGGANPFGFIGSLFFHANGGIAAHGKPLPTFSNGGISKTAAIFGEAGPEAAVPLPDGRRIPVELRMPAMPTAARGGQGGQLQVEVTSVIDDNGNIVPVVTRISGQVAGQTVRQYDSQLQNRTAEKSRRYG